MALISISRYGRHIVRARPARPVPPPPPPIPGGYLFRDQFNYVVDRDVAGTSSNFLANGWDFVKTQQDTTENPRGYLYTVDSIPGYTGPFPSGSPRVLCMEGRPIDANGTDFYLELGSGVDPASQNRIPGDVWFQYWLYFQNTPEQPGNISRRNKFMYVCNSYYPCHQYNWMMYVGTQSYPPNYLSIEGAAPPAGMFAYMAANPTFSNQQVVYPGWEEPDRWKFGQQDTSEFIRTNRWTQLKIHLDTTTDSGKYEMWMRPLGGAFLKVAEYIDGVNPPGFVWRIDPTMLGGHRVLRMPTTWGDGGATSWTPTWIYMDDFVMSSTEAGLP